MTDHVAEFYVRLRASRPLYEPSRVSRIKAMQLTQNPAGHDFDECVVKVRLRVPDGLFDPAEAEEINVPVDDLQVIPEAAR